MRKDGKHEHYEILNLIGYGLAKFNANFVKCFGLKTKTAFYEYIVKIGIAETSGTVKNRQDLFDPFFDNKRKGWWQKGNAYIHRKHFIDSLFGTLDANAYSDIVKLYLSDRYPNVGNIYTDISPIIKSKFKQLQITGQEAELFFMNNYQQIGYFKNGTLEDARIFGDGYDFQVEVQKHFYLAEIKGVRSECGSIRMTQNEFVKAKEFKNDYALVVISNLNDNPGMSVIFNPTDKIGFIEKTINVKQVNYHTDSLNWQSHMVEDATWN